MTMTVREVDNRSVEDLREREKYLEERVKALSDTIAVMKREFRQLEDKMYEKRREHGNDLR